VFDNLPKGQFKCIAADPPWMYGSDVHRKVDDMKRGKATKHYTCMSTPDLAQLPVDLVAADNCFLFLFATSSFLPDALGLVLDWGFTYKQTIPVVKTTQDGRGLAWGMGSYFRLCSEFLLVGTRGKPQRLNKGVLGYVEAPRGSHSEKPDVAFSMMEALCTGPRLELFARRPRNGWTVWGNEV